MAENESLDLSGRDATRWHPVWQAMRGGQSPEVVARRVEKALYGGLRAAVKQLHTLGVPLKALIEAARTPAGLDRLLRQAKGHDYARVLRVIAPETAGGSAPQLVRAFVEGIWDRIEDQLSQYVVPSDGCGSYPELFSRLTELQPLLSPIFDRLAERLAEDPTQVPRRPPRPRRRVETEMAETLEQSLLGMRPQ